jgi:hypothetical protein
MCRPFAVAVSVVSALIAFVVIGQPAHAQDSAPQVKFWPRHDISFPIDLAAFEQLDPRPSTIRFYSAPRNGKFTLIANKRANELDKIVDKLDPTATSRRGFTYMAAGDGEEEFAVQYEYAGGRLMPNTPTPQFRIHFDTKLPEVRATTEGTNAIRWTVTDTNLVKSSIHVEGQFPGETTWQILNIGDLKPDGSYRWTDIPSNKTLEVRVFARDLAGNSGYSKVVRLGAKADRSDLDFNSRRPEPELNTKRPGVGSFGEPYTRGSTGRVGSGSGFGGIDDLNTRTAKYEYRNTNQLNVKSRITHITRSGVIAAQLFVQNNSPDWVTGKKKDGLNFNMDSPNPTVEIDYAAPADGLYGFIIQPISGAGSKAEDPRPGDAPQYIVVVDTKVPEMTIRDIRIGGGGLNGPLVEIEYLSKDENEANEPITLEYSIDGKNEWKPIVAKTANTGRYTWEITDKKLWRFYVRATAVDLAGNSKIDMTKEPVLVDLDRPAGTVDQVSPYGQPTTGKQANRFDERSQPPALLNTTTTPADFKPGGTPALGIGGRTGPPTTPKPAEPKLEQPKPMEPKKIVTDMPETRPDLQIAPPKPIDVPMPIELHKLEPAATPPVETAPASGTIPLPQLPPTNEKK